MRGVDRSCCLYFGDTGFVLVDYEADVFDGCQTEDVEFVGWMKSDGSIIPSRNYASRKCIKKARLLSILRNSRLEKDICFQTGITQDT